MNKINKLNKFSYICRYVYGSIYMTYSYIRDNYCIIRPIDDDDEYYDIENQAFLDTH